MWVLFRASRNWIYKWIWQTNKIHEKLLIKIWHLWIILMESFPHVQCHRTSIMIKKTYKWNRFHLFRHSKMFRMTNVGVCLCWIPGVVYVSTCVWIASWSQVCGKMYICEYYNPWVPSWFVIALLDWWPLWIIICTLHHTLNAFSVCQIPHLVVPPIICEIYNPYCFILIKQVKKENVSQPTTDETSTQTLTQ